jgi:NADPH:quinone reductase-like Zn-dependent oxidoreductase
LSKYRAVELCLVLSVQQFKPGLQIALSDRMKAVRLLEYGGQLVFNDVPAPAIEPDEILLKIKSTAVNHLDLVKASGTVRQILPIDLPWIPGHEYSGVVEQIGSDVASWAPGDAVFGANGTGAAYAEYLAGGHRKKTLQPLL